MQRSRTVMCGKLLPDRTSSRMTSRPSRTSLTASCLITRAKVGHKTVAETRPLTFPAFDVIPWLRYTITERDAALPLGGDMSLSTGGSDPAGVVSNRERALQQIGATPERAVM